MTVKHERISKYGKTRTHEENIKMLIMNIYCSICGGNHEGVMNR